MHHYTVYEFHHCGHKWDGLTEKSRFRTCEQMIRFRHKTSVGYRIESRREFKRQFAEVFKDAV